MTAVTAVGARVETRNRERVGWSRGKVWLAAVFPGWFASMLVVVLRPVGLDRFVVDAAFADYMHSSRGMAMLGIAAVALSMLMVPTLLLFMLGETPSAKADPVRIAAAVLAFAAMVSLNYSWAASMHGRDRLVERVEANYGVTVEVANPGGGGVIESGEWRVDGEKRRCDAAGLYIDTADPVLRCGPVIEPLEELDPR